MNDFDNTADASSDLKAAGRTALQGAQEKVSDAKAAGREALEKVSGIAGDAVDSGRTYARAAVNSAGRKIGDLQGQLEEAGAYCTRLINADPVRAVAVAALTSAVVTALVVSALRRPDNRYF